MGKDITKHYTIKLHRQVKVDNNSNPVKFKPMITNLGFNKRKLKLPYNVKYYKHTDFNNIKNESN